MLKSIIHRVVLTYADLHYEGSLKVDSSMFLASGILEIEQEQVMDIDKRALQDTNLISWERGSGMVQVVGAAARLLLPGDCIVMSSARITELVPTDLSPAIILVDEKYASLESR